MVKTIHEETVITEEPTDIHHVELKTNEAKRGAPAPVIAPETPVPEVDSSFTCGWWCWLPLLCCLPLLCLPCLFCCKKKKPEYFPGPVGKTTRSETVAQKDLVAKEVAEYKVEKKKKKVKRATVRRVEEP